MSKRSNTPDEEPEDQQHEPEIDADPNGDDGLTMRQRLFVKAITGPALGNATKAAEMAGYKADNRITLAQTAYENLGKPYIQQAIAHALAEKCASPEWAQKQLIDLCRVDMSNFVTVGSNGKTKPDLAKAAALGALGQIREYDPETGKIKLHDKGKALALLLRLHKLIGDSEIASGADLSEEKEIRVRRVNRGKSTDHGKPDNS